VAGRRNCGIEPATSSRYTTFRIGVCMPLLGAKIRIAPNSVTRDNATYVCPCENA
jgi:hypothetical protein